MVTTVRPYSHIPERDLGQRRDKQARSRAKIVINYLEECVLCAEPRILPAGIEHIRRLDMSTRDRLFAIVYRALVEKLYSVEGEIGDDINMAQKGELSSATVYKKLCENDVDGHIVSKRRRTVL
jgi:hypothetical protein